MKCPKCNYESKGNSRFCVRCGTPLKESKKKPTQKRIILAILIIILIIILAALFVKINDTGLEQSTYTVAVDNVEFNLPHEGYFFKPSQYRFDYNGFECAVNHVEAFESNDDHRTIQSITLSKDYPGSQAYILQTISGEIWHGLKVKKDNEWFHISILTDDSRNAIEYFDWMYEHNDWQDHS